MNNCVKGKAGQAIINDYGISLVSWVQIDFRISSVCGAEHLVLNISHFNIPCSKFASNKTKKITVQSYFDKTFGRMQIARGSYCMFTHRFLLHLPALKGPHIVDIMLGKPLKQITFTLHSRLVCMSIGQN